MWSLQSKKRYTLLAGFLLVCIQFLDVHTIVAQEMMSENFRVQNSDIDQYGGYSTSTSFSNVIEGGLFTTGGGTSASFSSDLGPLNFDSFSPASQNWRWYDDEENETPSSALAAEDTAPAGIETDNTVLLRITVKETAGYGSADQKFRLQYSTASDFSSGVYDVAEIPTCNGYSEWCYDDGFATDNSLISTKVLSDADSCTSGVGDGCGTHNESATTTTAVGHAANAAAEYEFTVRQSGAAANTTYFFRLVNHASSSTVPFNTGESYPSLVTGGTELSFMISGVTSGTNTEGIDTDVTTTPTSVSFGTLSINSETEAAQQLTVSTNATNGYRIWAFQRQGLLNERAEEIDPVSGTNASPVGWTSGCSGSSFGCYGYHTGEDVLGGSSTRFSADDTFAQFAGTAEEVGFASTAVSNKTTDMVYKVEVSEQQNDGNYVGSVVYIVVPVF